MTNVSVPEVNMLKNSSTLAVSVPINISIKLGFVYVNGPGETYFVDVLRECFVDIPTYSAVSWVVYLGSCRRTVLFL